MAATELQSAADEPSRSLEKLWEPLDGTSSFYILEELYGKFWRPTFLSGACTAKQCLWVAHSRIRALSPPHLFANLRRGSV